MISANNFRALFGLARPKFPFNFNILFKAVAQHGIDGGLIGAILLYVHKLTLVNRYKSAGTRKGSG